MTFWIEQFGRIQHFSKNRKEKCHTYVTRYAFIPGFYNGLDVFFFMEKNFIEYRGPFGPVEDLFD